MIHRKLMIAAALVLLGGSAAMASKAALTGDTQHGAAGTTPCGGCHTPHAGLNGTSLLWVKSVGTSTYTVYTSASLKNPSTNIVSPGNGLLVAGTPSNNTLLCMSCHDGALAATNSVTLTTTNYGTVGAALSTSALLDVGAGGNLGNDHPVNLAHNPTLNNTLAAVAAVTTAGLQLYTGGAQTNFVECGTCHNPHQGPAGATNVPKSLTLGYYLRMANNTSQLCTTCHL